MLRIVPSPQGRAVIKTKSNSCFLRYPTLPFAPSALSLTPVEATDNPDGSTDIVLPWKPSIRTVEVA